MSSKLKIGDVFSVPIDSYRMGYGRIVDKFEKVLIYCVFYSDLLSAEKGTGSEILLAGITAGAKIKNGDWETIGNDLAGLDEIRKPNFKVMMQGSMYVVDFADKRRRKIGEEEADILNFRSIVAPIRYQNALIAHFGMGEWERPYDKLLYQNVIRSHEISLG
jgi:hypothetical protein